MRNILGLPNCYHYEGMGLELLSNKDIVVNTLSCWESDYRGVRDILGKYSRYNFTRTFSGLILFTRHQATQTRCLAYREIPLDRELEVTYLNSMVGVLSPLDCSSYGVRYCFSPVDVKARLGHYLPTVLAVPDVGTSYILTSMLAKYLILMGYERYFNPRDWEFYQSRGLNKVEEYEYLLTKHTLFIRTSRGFPL